MYAFIDAERWAEDGHPDLSERHSYLYGTGEYEHSCYGFLIVSTKQTLAMTLARAEVRVAEDQDVLPFSAEKEPADS